MGGKTSSPPAPDYTGAAQATSAGNLQNLQYQTAANRPNITTPWGTDTWSPPAANGSQSESINLTPAAQSALDAQQNIQSNQSNLAQTLQGQAASTMAGGFQAPQISSYMDGVPQTNTNFSQFSPTGVGTTNTAAPQFSDATAQAGANAAYQAQVGLLQPQMTQDTTNLDSQLRLQGLTPGSEAYNNAAQNLQRTQAQTLTTAANNAVQTGNNEANQNYSSELSGFNAGNSAQQQGYNQALGTYGANQTAQQNSNEAQNQQYGQSMQNYQTAYNSALGNYNEPLNAMNSVLNGQQVSMPNFGTYATAQNTPGTDYTTAAQNTGQYNSAQSAANGASSSSMFGSLSGLVGSGIGSYLGGSGASMF